MVEINNQRKAFLDMLAWSEELITDVRKPRNRWLWRHCRRAIYWLLRSPSQTCHLKPKTQINRRRTLPASFPLVGCLPQAAWPGATLEKVRTLWHCSKIKERGLTLDWSLICWYPSGNRPLQQYLGFTASGAGYGQFEHKGATATVAKFKEARRNGQRLMWAESPRLSPLWLSASSSACHGLLIITAVITPLPTKPSATKCQRTEAGERGNCWPQMRQRDVAALDAKYMKELADAKAENDALTWWCCRWSSSVAHQSSLSDQCVKPPPPPAWIMQPPRLADTAGGIISPSERGWSLCKNNWKEPRSILMSSADRVAHIDGQLGSDVSNTRASSGV